jgi:hypothetical protein
LARSGYIKALGAGSDSFDGHAARQVASDRMAALGTPGATKAGSNVAEVKLETRKLDCKVFLPATGSVITSKCSE